MNFEQFQTVLELADVAWLLNDSPRERYEQVMREMADVDAIMTRSFTMMRYAPVAEAILSDPDRLKPLVQTFASPMTAPIRAMVYCVLEGAKVDEVNFRYVHKQQSQLEVVVSFDSGESARFQSAELWDAEALRHFGLMKSSGKPVIDGYYAFRKAAT